LEGLRSGDGFTVTAKSVISMNDYQTLTLFYQPIIGKGAFVLYMTLLSLLNRQTQVSKEYLHSDLEALLNQPVGEIEKGRFRLEATGLVESYYLDGHFIYELKMPLSPSQFVNDGVLGEYVIQSITKERFKKLLELFKIKPIRKGHYIPISKSFDEVYQSIGFEGMPIEHDLFRRSTSKGVSVRNHQFDFRTFVESLPNEAEDAKNMGDVLKSKILNLAYVYGLSELELRDIFLRSYDSKLHVTHFDKLAKEARDYYKLVKKEVGLSEQKDVVYLEELPSDPETFFKVISPEQLLEELGDGYVSIADLSIAERLINDVGLDRGVTNVLLAYTYQIKEGILPSYEYFEKVGKGWKRNKVNSVEVALEYIKHLKAEYEKRKSSSSTTTKSGKKDIEIDWLDDYYNSI